ncbi:hypothetical protein QTP86_026233 [Hemibagrus guttatus]|nr:hypothetical protein QTP86_026233 [Hemibagrus guttatus]
MSKIKSIIWPQVVLFGDSITQFSFQAKGWGSDIASRLARKCDVVNRGLSGYNTRWAKLVLPRIIPNHGASHPSIAAVIVFFGANDAALEDKNPQQHVPCEEYSENLKDIVTYLASAGVPKDKVIFIAPPPIQEKLWEKECILKGCSLNRLNSVAGQYARVCVQTAGRCGVDVIDLWSLMKKRWKELGGKAVPGGESPLESSSMVAIRGGSALGSEQEVVGGEVLLPLGGPCTGLAAETEEGGGGGGGRKGALMMRMGAPSRLLSISIF